MLQAFALQDHLGLPEILRVCINNDWQKTIPTIGLCFQVTGDASIGEFASTNDEDEFTYSITAAGDEEGRQELVQLMQSLKEPVFKRLQTYAHEIQNM